MTHATDGSQTGSRKGDIVSERELVYMLFGAVGVAALVLVFVSWLLPENPSLYSTVASLLSGFAGALFAIIRNHVPSEESKPPTPATPAPPPAPGGAV
jgi:hypothetical protein